jgi:hypothetical protein
MNTDILKLLKVVRKYGAQSKLEGFEEQKTQSKKENKEGNR